MKYKILYTEIKSKDAYKHAKENIIGYIHKQGTLVQPSLRERLNHQWRKDQFGVVVYDKGNYSYHLEAHKRVRRLEIVIYSTDDEDLEKRVEELKFGANLKEANY